MNRGILNFLSNDPIYKSSKKEWLVELQQSQMYWYELLVNGHEEIDTRKFIFDQVKKLKEEVESCLEKRFVYFICSRIKVRFCSDTLPVLTPFHGFMKLRVLVGREKEPKEFVVNVLYDENRDVVIPKIDETGRFIIFTHQSGHSICFSIHDYLMNFCVNLGYSTKVEYVGVTKNPNNRPLNGVHGGLSDVLYNVSHDENDILIFFNLFKVTNNAAGNKYNIHYNIANAMTDEIKVNQEGEVIEKSFRFYFDSDTQKRHKNTERREITNDLREMSEKNNIKSVHVFYEVEDDSEYYEFYSSKVSPKRTHYFTVELNDDDIYLTNINCTLEEFLIAQSNF
ncbi:hypothetical protein [Aeromonas hydrophila]|uniref:hypothetical protein n=1 Tax=Aeromonas hydrophila TaxID=644 RepID=UPI001C5BCEE7|nr:hypothetical protein [Aeromonas hydrophila]MBW3833896.1 hypothetical protein [Aeromonas hydrophila]MBW5266026.1 hypothetical protein [Aeromonas hydrophila]MBW5279719.1 hypothetical protein [Aeromonas hydrophila]